MKKITMRGLTADAIVRCQNCGNQETFGECQRTIEDFDERVRPGEICPAGECEKCGCLLTPVLPQANRKLGINPLTIRTEYPGERNWVTFHRLGLKVGDNDRSAFTVAIYPKDPGQGDPIISQPMYEQEFLHAIGHLFPNGELSDVHIQKE